MPNLNRAEIEQYLTSVIESGARILNLKVLGESEAEDIKGYTWQRSSTRRTRLARGISIG